MVKYQGYSRRKISGGLRRKSAGKKLRHLGRPATQTHLGELKKKKVRTMGGNIKVRLASENMANVLDKKTGKVKKVKIIDLDTNPSSREYTRRRILTKGAIVDTELGKARITNRPGSEPLINAVLLDE